MIEHTGNTCTVNGTCFTITRTCKKESDLLSAFGAIGNADSCYRYMWIADYARLRHALIAACEISGIKYNLPEIPPYANESKNKAAQFARFFSQ